MAEIRPTLTTSLGGYQARVDQALVELKRERTLARIWAHDHTVWKPKPEEISNRLGWLHSMDAMQPALEEIEQFVEGVRQAGYTRVLLMGMGGSSLAPEVFSKTFGVRDGYLELDVLDSTDPGAVLMAEGKLDLEKTLFIVSSKSGGTVETLSAFKYFYNRVVDMLGAESAGEHFAGITDPGSKLAELAVQREFRAVFLNDPNIGGRFSALSYFGLVPAALLGVDLETLLERARSMAAANKDQHESADAVLLGAVLGELALADRDKVTFFTSPEIASFGDWVEQLIAESTGKEGVGILPVVGGRPGTAGDYGNDRLFVHLQLAGEPSYRATLEELEAAGHPILRIQLADRYDLGGQFTLWELATAIAGQRLGINPFDQPNVESAKVRAKEMVAAYQAEGSLPELEPALEQDGMLVYTDPKAEGQPDTPGEIIEAFLGRAQPGAYLAIQAYVNPTPKVEAALAELRTALRGRTGLATTLGYGPRFLHSTGQLHKGDAGRGLFIQITADSPRDLAIPDELGAPDSSISFGVLKSAQALGDRQALLDAGRGVLRFHIKGEVAEGVSRITRAIK